MRKEIEDLMGDRTTKYVKRLSVNCRRNVIGEDGP